MLPTKILIPGTGNQTANRRRAIEYIGNNILELQEVDDNRGNVRTSDGKWYHVSAYAESAAAFISTPGEDKSKHSIYESGLDALMYRQVKGDDRAFIYEVVPREIPVKSGSSSAQWPDISKSAHRVWVCTKERINVIDR